MKETERIIVTTEKEQRAMFYYAYGYGFILGVVLTGLVSIVISLIF